MKTFVYEINSADEMEALGERIGKSLAGGTVLLLTGELGAGKTVFCKGLAKGLGITVPVVSPTFTIMNEYYGGNIKLCHFDAYRLADEEEAYGAGLTDFIGSPDCVCAVEWWENVPGLFDGLDNLIKVDVEKTGENTRRVTVER